MFIYDNTISIYDTEILFYVIKYNKKMFLM